MRTILPFVAFLLILLPHAQAAPLQHVATIPLPDVSGRIDHMAIDLGRKRLFVAELGNGSVDAIDLTAQKPVQRISGLHEPQGVAYSAKADLVFVASAGDGTLRMYRGSDLAPVGRIDLHSDADNLRVDPRNGNVVAGYGEGGLAIVDPQTRTLIARIALPAHPEAFAIRASDGRAFVNIPDADQIAVVDLDARKIVTHWSIPFVAANFPMALDPAGNRLAVVFRSPSRLVLVDATNGSAVTRLPVCDDADDVFFDPPRQRLYVSCGAGEVAAFDDSGGQPRMLAALPAASGARTSLFVPQLDTLFVAVRAGWRDPAAIWIVRPVS